MGFGGSIVSAVISAVVLIILVWALNIWLGDNIVFNFFHAVMTSFAKVMTMITDAFTTGSIGDMGFPG